MNENFNDQSAKDFLEEELNAIITTDGKPTELLATKPSGIEFLNPADFPDLDEAEEGISLETKYFEFNVPGLIVRAIFNGIGVMKKRNSVGNLEEIPAVYFQTKDGVYLNGGDNLVNQLQHVKPGTPIQITYIGKQKTASNNNVNKFDVKVLNLRQPF